MIKQITATFSIVLALTSTALLATFPLYDAAKKGDIEQLRILLQQNPADVNTKDSYDKTPLHYAAIKGHFECVKALLGFRANIEAKNTLGSTPLHSAVEYGHLECVQVLLQHQANVNEKNNLGLTPLHIAAAKGRRECVEELLKNDADITAKTVFGKTAKDLAKGNGHHHIVKLLDEYDAEERRTQMHNQKLKKIMCDFCDDFFSPESVRKVGKNHICSACLGIGGEGEVSKD